MKNLHPAFSNFYGFFFSKLLSVSSSLKILCPFPKRNGSFKKVKSRSLIKQANSMQGNYAKQESPKSDFNRAATGRFFLSGRGAVHTQATIKPTVA